MGPFVVGVALWWARAGKDGGARPEKRRQPFFGLTTVLCKRGAVRQSSDGLYDYTEKGREEVPVPPMLRREAGLSKPATAIRDGRAVFPDGTRRKATLEVCLAILASSRDGRAHRMRHHVPARG